MLEHGYGEVHAYCLLAVAANGMDRPPPFLPRPQPSGAFVADFIRWIIWTW